MGNKIRHIETARYCEARAYLRGQMGHESAKTRDAFAEWYAASSEYFDPKVAWNFYRRQVLHQGASLVDTSDWSRLAEVDAYAARHDITRGEAVRRLVNHALSEGAK